MSKDNAGGKRILEPTYTDGYVHIIYLRKKLKWLYGYHPFVTAQYKLAQAMSVAPATLATWLNGVRIDDGRTVAIVNPDSIPTKQLCGDLGIATGRAGNGGLDRIQECAGQV